MPLSYVLPFASHASKDGAALGIEQLVDTDDSVGCFAGSDSVGRLQGDLDSSKRRTQTRNVHSEIVAALNSSNNVPIPFIYPGPSQADR